MSTLLLRLTGPMQSWGVQSRFTVRDTGLEPSKSGVVGLLCAALGRPRHEPVQDLVALMMAVRVDQEGVIQRDYHTAGKEGFLRASGAIEREQVVVSSRYYLADARFLVGLAGDSGDLLTRAHKALRDPQWPLYLGRKAFVPGEPVWLPDGLCPEGGLLDILTRYHWLGTDPQRRPEQLRVVMEDPDGPEVRPDQPVSFALRLFAPRRVRTLYIKPTQAKEELCISPD
ncbi:MAG TPA: type I-E CRISPR-associated protein Cas5/CasD [Anaerolineae bacterium]|nr:type I-E CRISPR-associated protein Cas5/CasD [Anaerolineae bacterium]